MKMISRYVEKIKEYSGVNVRRVREKILLKCVCEVKPQQRRGPQSSSQAYVLAVSLVSHPLAQLQAGTTGCLL